MFTLRAATRTQVGRSLASRPVANASIAAAVTGRRYVQQGYGDDTDNAIADTPEARKEKSGQEQSSSKQKSGEQSQQTQKSSNSGSKKPSSSKGTQGAQPKILSDNPPHEGEEPPDVAQHNADMRKRVDNAHEKVKDEDFEKDKVSKRFWAGAGGVDKDP